MKRIVSVTGIRSEYDIMSSVYAAITARKDLNLSLIVTGAHLSKDYGLTVEQIRGDGFCIAEEVESLINGDNDASRLKGLSVQLMGLTQSIQRLKPDMLLIFGDREECLTTAIVGTYLNIPIAHISGGDRVIGNVDDHVRHAVTKLAHLHFTTSEDSKNRILKMGEQPFRVFNTGNPGLDRLAAVPAMSREELLRWYGFTPPFSDKPLIVLIQHALSSEYREAYAQTKVSMEVIRDLGYYTVISYPNSDAGSHEIIRCLKEYENLPFVRMHKNIPRTEFVNTLRLSRCLLGNSSSGLLEAPFLKLPAVNIGNRQKGRLHAKNVTFVPHDFGQIRQSVLRACNDEAYRKECTGDAHLFGDGKSSPRIAEILAKTVIDEKLLLKDITY